MVEAAAASNPMTMFCEADFPASFVHMAHPLDYVVSRDPILPEYIYHHKGRHRRLIFRVSWKTQDSTFIPMSFVCDTGAPYFLYLSDQARDAMGKAGIIKEDEKGDEFVTIKTDNAEGEATAFVAGIEDTPDSHKPANLIGLSLLLKLGLQLKSSTFTFTHQIKHF